MNTKTFKAQTTKEALSRISRELGPDAIIVSQRKVKDSEGRIWAEIIAAPRAEGAAEQQAALGGLPSILKSKAFIAGAIGGLIAVVILLIVLFIFPRLRDEKEQAALKTPLSVRGQVSIAVLPFVDLSPNGDQGYFCDGISEEIINKLIQIKVLKLDVASSTSSFSFKNKDASVTEIGHSLGVSTVLEGSVRWGGDRVRIKAQLNDVETGLHIWSQVYEHDLSSILSKQDEIAFDIVRAMMVELRADELRYVEDRSIAPQAYEFYKKGMHLLKSGTLFAEYSGYDLFQAAIDEDPNFALPYIGMSALSYDPHEGRYKPERKYLLKAVELDNHLGDAYAELANLKYIHDWDWEAAEELWQKALELDPFYPEDVNIEYAYYLACQLKTDEAYSYMQRALEQDPFSPVVNLLAGKILMLFRQFKSAEQQFMKMREMFPEHLGAMVFLTWTRYLMGKHDEAIEMAIIAHDFLYKRINRAAEVRKRYDAEGFDGFMRYLNEYMPQFEHLGCEIAWNYAELGETDEAFRWLHKAVEDRDPKLAELVVHPLYDKIRDDSRFIEILEKVSFQDYAKHLR